MSIPHPGICMLVVPLAILLGVGCSQPTPKPSGNNLRVQAFSGSNALAEAAAFVSVGPRVSGTPGALAGAQHVRDRLRNFGLTAQIESFPDATPSGTTTFHNVYATIPGQASRTILLMSHIDTKGGISAHFAGANDSGSSTGLLLELARLVSAAPTPPPASLLFAFLDGEECATRYGPIDGLHGSRHLLASLQAKRRTDDIVAVLLVDMIGDKNLKVTIPANTDAGLAGTVLSAARALGVRRAFTTSRGVVIDDHAPFHDAGIPAVDLIDFEFGSEPGRNDYWHTPEDTLDKLSPDSLELVGRVLIETLNRLAE